MVVLPVLTALRTAMTALLGPSGRIVEEPPKQATVLRTGSASLVGQCLYNEKIIV
jgi:hypothetical protein